MADHWEEQAECRGAPMLWFFPQDDDYSPDNTVDALLLCAGCPVRLHCKKFAMSTEETRDHGVWGGTTPDQRRRP